MNQFQKTQAEREAIKQAKRAYKNNDKGRIEIFADRHFVNPKERILTGIMEGEDILPNDFKVYPDYCYVVEFKDGTGKVIKSDYGGTVVGFKRDLVTYPSYKDRYKDLVNIRNCEMGIRNLF